MKGNTLSIWHFTCASVVFGAILNIAYRNMFFKKVFELDFTKSYIILLVLTFGVMIINFIVSGKYARNEIAVAATAIIPYGVYSAMSYFRYMRTTFIWIIILCLIAAAVYIGMVVSRKIRNENIRGKIIRRRIRKCYIGTRNIVAIACLAIVASVYVQTRVIGGLAIATNVKPAQLYGDEYSMSNNMDMFLYLQPEEWEKIQGDLELKLDILQTVLNCEGRYLSFNRPITLHAADLSYGTLAYYNHDEGTIYIDIAHMDDSSEEVLRSLLHEAFHCAQNQYSEIYRSLDVSDQNSYFMLDAALYTNEIENYVEGSKNFHAYYSQRLEADARAYGITSTSMIFNRIDEYLDKGGEW